MLRNFEDADHISLYIYLNLKENDLKEKKKIYLPDNFLLYVVPPILVCRYIGNSFFNKRRGERN